MLKFAYLLLASLFYVLGMPLILLLTFREKHKEAIPARFFLKNNPRLPESKIWFHSSSMGETKALKPIIEQLNEEVNMTVFTNTGHKEAQKLSSNVRYLPFDIFLPFWQTKQKVLVVMEAELWLMLFYLARRQGAKTMLINARISDRSYKSYQRFAFYYKQVFKHIDKVFAQTEVDKERLSKLGAKNIEVIGNIKLASLPKVSKQLEKPKGLLLTAGSTHGTEEELILRAWKKEQGKLLIVPRHPERFAKVHELMQGYAKKENLSYHRYSKQEDFESDLVLVDKMGELLNIYAISDVVILGGAFIETAGGHNPIEPAFFNCKILSGKNVYNQKSLFDCVRDYKLIDPNELQTNLDDLNSLKQASLKQAGSVARIIEEINT